MMKKRILSLTLAVTMLLSLLPGSAFSALTGTAVTYTRKNPEYPILNAYTGSNDAFYERIKNVEPYTKYNASAHFGYAALGYNAVLVDDFMNGTNSINYEFRNYDKSVIREVSSTRDNLQSNFSATFYNRWHTHNTGLGGLGAAYSVLAFMRGGLWTGGPLNYYNSFDKKTEELPRFGDNQYAVVPYSKEGKLPLKLHFEKSAVKFTSELTCECGGSYVTNTMVVFKDDRAPKIKSITGVAIVPTDSTKEIEPTKYTPGGTIKIVIEYDEPIRFADDSATGKEDLGISLKIDGLATPWKAKLTKLENNTLTFSYPIPNDYVGDALITALDLEPLTGQKNLKLVQVGKQKESFTVAPPDNVATLGYSTTTSYITDLAGNALNREIVPVRASVDTAAPYVSEVTFAVHPRNEDVKAMLKENGGTQKAGELDNSDTHLGLYDYLYVGLNLNERLKVAGVGTYPTPVLTGCVATTNIKDKDGNYVTLSDPYVHAHISPEGLPITRLDFKESLTVFEGMTCDDADGRIRITKLEIPATVTDLAGNPFDTTAPLPDTAGAYLDALPPVIATTQTPDTSTKKYAVIEENGGFYFPITLNDGTSGSGVNAVNGYFVFRNDTMFEGLVGNDRYGKEHAFQYAVTALAETTVDTKWTDGKMGTRYPFVQVEKGNYIHIRLKTDEVYSVSDCSLDVYGCDLAGNESYELYSEFGKWCTKNNQTAQCVTNFPLSWQKDSVPPTAEVGAVKRTLEGENGKLTVEVALKDLIQLDTTAKFLWNDGAKPADDAAWTNVTDTITGSKATVTATTTVNKGETFSQHLWISTSDKSSNALIKDMGVFAYNLVGVKYTIDYSKGITKKPAIMLQTLPADGAIAVIVGHGDRNAALVEGQQYAVRLVRGSDAFTPQELLTQSDDPNNLIEWYLATYTVGVNNEHVFAYDVRTDINNLAVAGWYTGDVTVTLMSTTTSGATQAKDAEPSTAIAGKIIVGADGQLVGTETVQLRSATNAKDGHGTPALQTPTLTVDDPNATKKQSDASYVPGTDPVVRSTLEGLTFTVGIEKTATVPDWVMDDINYNNSSIELVSGSETITVPLRPGSNVVTVPPRADAQGRPTEPYGSGVYTATLKVVCDAGGSYETALGQNIYIDATPEKKFTIAPLSYKLEDNAKLDYRKYGLKDRTTTPQMCLVENGVTYLPVTDSVSKLELTMDTTDLPTQMPGDTSAFSGTYAVYAWNSSAGVDEKASREAANFISSDASSLAYAFDIALVDSANKVVTGYADKKLPLIRDTENIITVQVVNGNGILSEKRTLRVFPKSSPAVKGTLSQTHHEINGGNVVSHGDVVFTPDKGQNMAGVQLFASQLKDGIVIGDDAMEGIFTQEMMPTADGSYHIPMFIKAGGSGCYTVFAQDRYGNVTKFTYTSGGTERTYIDEVTLDNNPPVVTQKSLTAADGLYEAVFTVDDISILSMNADRKEVYMDLNLSLSFDAAHTKALGLPEGAQLNLLITGLTTDNDYPHGSANEFYYFAWTPESCTHETGIYDVYVVKVDRKLEVHVLGAVGYAPGVGENPPLEKMPAFDLNLAVTDGFGYTGTGTAKIEAQPNVKPEAVTTGDGAPAYIDNLALANDKMLQLNFTAPIKPEYSWIYPAPDKTNINWDVLEKFDRVFTDAFPITDDGEWEIHFTDHFGTLWAQKLTLTNVFGDYGYQVGFSTLEVTKPPVTVSAVIDDATSEYKLMSFGDFGRGLFIAKADGAMDDFHASTPAKEKRYTVTEDDINQELKSFIFILCDENYKYYDKDDNLSALKGDRLTVYLPNVVTKAPVAKPRFFLDGDRSEYNESSLPRGTISGNIRATYATDRPVMPAKGTGDSYTFTPGGPTEYTFHYVDGFGFEGSCTVNLNALLVTLAPSAPKSYEDTDAPQVNVDIYAKRLGGYTPAGAFTMQANVIPKAFSDVGYVQGYNLKINATDRSSYKIVLLKTAPTTLTYAGAVSETIDGVSLLGNMITITKPATFTVAVVDNAKAESVAAESIPEGSTTLPPHKDRFTAFTIDSTAQLSKWIDTTAPTAEMKFETGATLYQRMGYIRFSDDKMEPVTLDSPVMTLETAAGDYQGWYKRLFNTNESIQVLFHDAAGNSAIADFAVEDISSAKPVLTKSWSPFRFMEKFDPITHEPVLDENGNPILEAHHDLAPSGPLNGDVTVTVSSDVPIVTAEYSTDMKTWMPLTATPVALTEKFSGVTLARMGDSVVATYSQGGPDGLHLKFTAPNGKIATEIIQLNESVIDKTAPTFTPEVTEVKRDKATKPYAATITVTPKEKVTCSNYNTLDKDGKKIEYGLSNPITMTVTKDGDYPFHLLDLAGNAATATVKVNVGIDRKAPTITTTPVDTTKLEPTKDGVVISVTTDEACTVTCGKQTLDMTANTPKDITITENGSYAIVATDPAGNVTIKSVTVGTIDKLAPTVSFDTGTISIRQGSTLADLEEKLKLGVTVQDNMAKNLVPTTDAATAVPLDTVGTYTVTFTATDAAGNKGTNSRFVRVYDKDLPIIAIDGEKTDPFGTMVLKPGAHKITVENLKTITAGVLEPYTLKISRGIYTAGQMKNLPNNIEVGADGSFTIERNAFYTLYIITQSRYSFVTTLYVEQ